MSDNLRLWSKFCRPPQDALKKITGGRLSGKSDINPQWRMEAMTEALGPCGIGWRYEIVSLWTEPGTDGQVCAFARVDVRIKDADQWSEPIPGIGGAMLIEKEKNGLHTSDEAFKMAVTDALSVAFKALGVAADIYRGRFDGSKYAAPPRKDAPESAPEPAGAAIRAKALPYIASALEAAFPRPAGEDIETPEGQKRVIRLLFGDGSGDWEQVTQATPDLLAAICRKSGGRDSDLEQAIETVKRQIKNEAAGALKEEIESPGTTAEQMRKDIIEAAKGSEAIKALVLDTMKGQKVFSLSEIGDLKILKSLADRIDRIPAGGVK